MTGSVWTIIVAGGGGTRFGGAKQFELLDGHSVLDRSVATAIGVSDGVVVVLPSDAQWTPPAGVVVAAGGATRSQSTRNGLALVPADATIVLVHDAARPLCRADLYEAVIAAVRSGADAAIPALAISDTVKRVEGDRVVATVRRDDLATVQTPQAFAVSALRDAHATGLDDTDDAAIVERRGGVVVTVPGDPRNLKITVPADLTIATALLEVE